MNRCARQNNWMDSAEVQDLWNTTEAARDYSPVPAGTYTVDLVEVSRDTTRNGNPCVNLELQIREGEYARRFIRYSLFLTPKATAYAKRELGKIGVTRLEQLDSPPPKGIRCSVAVSKQTEDGGRHKSKVTAFEFLGIDAADEDGKEAEGDEGGAIEAPGEAEVHEDDCPESDIDDPLFAETNQKEGS